MFKKGDKVIVLIDKYIENLNKEIIVDISEEIGEEYRRIQEENGGYLTVVNEITSSPFCSLENKFGTRYIQGMNKKCLIHYVEGKLPDNLFTF